MVAGNSCHCMNNHLYTSIISQYFPQVCPEGPLHPPVKELYREISRHQQPSALGLQTGFAIKVIKYIQHVHRFNYKPFLGTPTIFSLILNIHPENNFGSPAFSLQYSFPDKTPKYFISWNYIPCIIPHFLHQALITRVQFNNLNLQHLVQEVTTWWDQLLLNQFVLAEHLCLTQQTPYLPYYLNSPLPCSSHPLNTDPLVTIEE